MGEGGAQETQSWVGAEHDAPTAGEPTANYRPRDGQVPKRSESTRPPQDPDTRAPSGRIHGTENTGTSLTPGYGQTGKQNAARPPHGVLFSHEKERSFGTCHSANLEDIAAREKNQAHWVPLSETSRTGEFTDRMWQGAAEHVALMDTVSSERTRAFWNWWWQLHDFANALKTAELYTSEECTLWRVNDILTKL